MNAPSLIPQTGLCASKVQESIKNQQLLLRHCVPSYKEQLINNYLLEDLLVHLDMLDLCSFQNCYFPSFQSSNIFFRYKGEPPNTDTLTNTTSSTFLCEY